MSRLLAWPVLASLAAGAGTLALVRFLLPVRDRPGARWFLVALGVQAVLCFAYTAALVVTAPTLRWALEVVTVVALHWLGFPFLGFALAYTGRSDYLRSWYYRSLFVFPLLATVLAPTNPLHHLFWTDFTVQSVAGVAGATYTSQPLLFATMVPTTIVTATATLLLLETFVSYGPLYRGEAFAVGLSPFPPAIGVILWLFDLGPVPALNLAAPLFLPHVVLDAYAFVWSDMFEFHPATRRAAERSALDDLGSPVLVLDVEGRVVDFNDPARALLDVDDPVTVDIETALGAAVDVEGESQRLALDRDGQPREYRVTPAPLTDPGDNHVGYTLVLQDVTEEVRREQRLQVLNRVLRHNLRNDLSVVQGNVAVAREAVDGDRVADLLATAESKTEELAATGEKARDVAETVRNAGDDSMTVDVSALCGDVVEEFREDGASVTVDGLAEARIRTSPELLTAVVENLVENAVEHGTDGERGADGTPVRVTVDRPDADWVSIAVSDDGPGIPAGELRPIRAGEETDLEHGSGFGLWLVTWGVELLGGEVTFDTGEGTTVTVRVPDEGERSAADGDADDENASG